MARHFDYNSLIIFCFGAVSYGLIEVVSRGFTHPSMLLAGGICFLSMWWIDRSRRISFVTKCILSAVIVTAVEFLFGYIFNIVLKLNVWDYSKEPFNFLGQICLKFFLIWCFLSAGGLLLSRFISKALKRQI